MKTYHYTTRPIIFGFTTVSAYLCTLPTMLACLSLLATACGTQQGFHGDDDDDDNWSTIAVDFWKEEIFETFLAMDAGRADAKAKFYQEAKDADDHRVKLLLQLEKVVQKQENKVEKAREALKEAEGIYQQAREAVLKKMSRPRRHTTPGERCKDRRRKNLCGSFLPVSWENQEALQRQEDRLGKLEKREEELKKCEQELLRAKQQRQRAYESLKAYAKKSLRYTNSPMQTL